jgi:hypothetical protein
MQDVVGGSLRSSLRRLRINPSGTTADLSVGDMWHVQQSLGKETEIINTSGDI